MYVDNNKNKEIKKVFNEIDNETLSKILNFWNPSRDDARHIKYYFVLTQQYTKAAICRDVERRIAWSKESDEYLNEKMQECIDIFFDKLNNNDFLDSLKKEGLI